MMLRAFTDIGEEAFGIFLTEIKNGQNNNKIISRQRDVLLYDDDLSKPIDPPIDIQSIDLSDRFTAGVSLCELLKNHPLHYTNKGIWSWLSLYYFDELCPLEKDGTHRIDAHHRHIMEGKNFQHYYRHLLSTPFNICLSHKDDYDRTKVLLNGPCSVHGDITEQLASRQTFVTSKPIMEVLEVLYLDPITKKNKTGAAGGGRKDTQRLGNVRRFIDILWQLDLTYDLYDIKTQDLLDLLPDEFDDFKPQTQPDTALNTI